MSEFLTLKGIRSIHIRDIHIRNHICNTNKQERLNGEFAGRFRYARGINKEESRIFRITILHHNYIVVLAAQTPGVVAHPDGA